MVIMRIIQTFNFHSNLDKNHDAFHFVVQVNNRSERMWRIYFKCLIGVQIIASAMACASVLLYWIMSGKFDVDHLIHQVRLVWVHRKFPRKLNQSNWLKYSFLWNFSLPWDQRTPLGYFGEVFFANICGQVYMLVNGSLLLLLISICWHYQAFYQMFRSSIEKLKFRDNHRNDAKILCQSIELHVSMKEWVWALCSNCI